MGESVTVTKNPDGTFTVNEQQVTSFDEVVAVLRHELDEDEATEGSPQSQAWNAEAKGRDASGFRQGPPMSM